MSIEIERERGTIPTPEQHDPLDWAVSRLSWERELPEDFEYGYTVWPPPIIQASNKVIKAMIQHMIRNADYDGLAVAMNATYRCMAEQESWEDRIEGNRALNAEVRAMQLRVACCMCSSLAGEPCVTKSGNRLHIPHSRRGKEATP